MKKEWMLVILTIIASAFSRAETIQANQYAIWGISDDEIVIPEGFVITEAVLTITEVTPQDTHYYVHLLDNTNPGFQRTTTTEQGNDFEGYGVPLQGAFEDGNLVFRFSQNNDAQSRMWTVYANPCTLRLANASTVSLSSSILELMEYAGNGKGFGIGLDKEYDGQSFAFQDMTLVLTLQSYSTVSAAQTLTFSYETETDYTRVPGLAGYWKLDERWGSAEVEDFGPNGASGVASAATSSLSAEGDFDGGFQFDGTQSVTIADHDGLDMGTDDFSISFSFKLDKFNPAAAWNTVLSKGALATRGAYYGMYVARNSKLYFMVGGTSQYACSNFALNDGLLHHIVAMRAGGNLVLYVDGVMQDKIGVYAGTVSNESDLMIGGDGTKGGNFCGMLDEIRIYQYALTAEEIYDLTVDSVGTRFGLVSAWKLADNSGSKIVANSVVSTARGTCTVKTSSLYTDQGFRFTGTQRVAVANKTFLNMGTEDFSIALAMKLDENQAISGWNALLAKGRIAATGAFYGVYAGSDKRVYFMVGGSDNYACSDQPLDDGRFHSIIAMRSGGQLVLYVDGVAQSQTGFFDGSVTNRVSLQIGGDGVAGRNFYGVLGDIRLYKCTLPADQIDQIQAEIMAGRLEQE